MPDGSEGRDAGNGSNETAVPEKENRPREEKSKEDHYANGEDDTTEDCCEYFHF